MSRFKRTPRQAAGGAVMDQLYELEKFKRGLIDGTIDKTLSGEPITPEFRAEVIERIDFTIEEMNDALSLSPFVMSQ
jgi:hypothetical protein